jgi:hypothetical protein
MILCKSSVLLEDEHYSQILHLSWELLLDRNEELSACAGKNQTKYSTKSSISFLFQQQLLFLQLLVLVI